MVAEEAPTVVSVTAATRVADVKPLLCLAPPDTVMEAPDLYGIE